MQWVGASRATGSPNAPALVVKGLNVLRDLTFGLLMIDEAPVMDQLCLQ
jgi:hypothetical protein